jgi:hypothetical protein
MPMDETLAIAAVDLSGRAAFAVDTKVRTRLVGDLQTELVTDFFEGFARGARANVHVKTMYGRSNHHKIEAIFKAFARALRVACSSATSNWARCCPRRRDCCDARNGDRLQSRQSDLGAEDAAPPGRGAEVTDGDLRWLSRRSASCCPAWATLQRPSGSTRRA